MSATADALLLRQIRQDLPGFPDEVLREWIAPCARRNGWPPVAPVWLDILLGIPIVVWRAMRWTQEDRPLEWGHLSANSARLVRNLYDAHFNRNPRPAIPVPEGGLERVQRALVYLSDHGVMPGRIVVAEGPDGRLALADGYHRVTAYFVYRMMLAEPTIRATLPPPVAEVNENQPMWVARI
ncbi:MAG: hypothetical protein ACRD88_17680 [Terriglobia bacterium]